MVIFANITGYLSFCPQHFVSERKYDEDLGKAVRFTFDLEPLKASISGFGSGTESFVTSSPLFIVMFKWKFLKTLSSPNTEILIRDALIWYWYHIATPMFPSVYTLILCFFYMCYTSLTAQRPLKTQLYIISHLLGWRVGRLLKISAKETLWEWW